MKKTFLPLLMLVLACSVFTAKALVPPSVPGWYNLQWPASGEVQAGGTFTVYAQVWMEGVTEAAGQGAGMQAWIGVSTENTNPSTWTNWISASFNTNSGNNDEFMANIATGLSAGTYYYASRFQYNDGAFVYGGTGGPWNGTGSNSGVLTVTAAPPVPQIEWANLQWPGTGNITPGTSYDVYAQVYKGGVTEAAGQGAGIQVWIGVSTTDTNPSSWTNWISAAYHADNGNNDEYKTNIATGLAEGTYYYASRFQLGTAAYLYGGFQSGFWDGTTNVNGVLVVSNGPVSGITASKNDELNVFVNAARQLVVVQNGQELSETISVFSLSGQQLNDVRSNGAVTTLNFSFEPGMYLVKAGTLTRKLIVR